MNALSRRNRPAFNEWREEGREPDEVIDMLDDQCKPLEQLALKLDG